MADREGPATAPGQVFIEVQYDYEYTANDNLVIIRQGESYLLVEKTNENWWQVMKDDGANAFYVPAQYVREMHRDLMPPNTPVLMAKPTVLDICQASDENLNRPHLSSFRRSPPSTPSPSCNAPPAKDANQNVGSPLHSQVVGGLVLLHNNNLHLNSVMLPPAQADCPPPEIRHGHSNSSDSGKMSSPGDDTSPSGVVPRDKIRTDSESGDELNSSSTEHMQVRCCLP